VKDVSAASCPYPAIGAIAFRRGEEYEINTGTYVNEESWEDKNRVLKLRFWRSSPPKSQAVVIVNVHTRKAYATFGRVKRIGESLCAFSE
jgi:hypothetical protein